MEKLQCLFCQNLFSNNEVIKINENAIQSEDVIVEFSDLVEEIFGKKVNLTFFQFSQQIKINFYSSHSLLS